MYGDLALGGAGFRVQILKQENLTRNNSRKIGVRRRAALSHMIIFSFMLRVQLYDTSSPVPSTAIKLEPSGQWFGGGFQGWRDPLVLPLNDARIAKKWFLADENTQGTPFWYSTKGIAVWVRTSYDFQYSVNAEANGTPDGLLRIEVPLASELRYDILLAPDLRQVLQRI